MCNIEVTGNTAYLFTPYNPDFVRKIKKIGGAKWNADRKAWSVPAEQIDAARETMRAVYGCDDRPLTADDLVTLRVTFDHEHEHYEVCQPFILYGKTISSAHGRDTGARPGDDVVILSGGVTSGGSRANWQSVVRGGTVARLSNVPRALYENPDEAYYGATVEIIDDQTDVDAKRAALTDERDRLQARLAAIEKELQAL